MFNSFDDNIRDLVERARNGDQNAMGMIAAIRESADAGSAKALKSHKAIIAYCNAHPITGTRIGVEAKETLREIASAGTKEELTRGLVKLPIVGGRRAHNCAVVILANTLPLTDDVLEEIVETIQDDKFRNVFLESALDSPPSGLPNEALPFLYAGLCVGKARALQMIHADIGYATPSFGREYGYR